MRFCILFLQSLLPLFASLGAAAAEVRQPKFIGNWWTIAGDPDLGALTTTNQQPVDFGIWQARDGTWQLWSCIRGTKEPGNTRLFHRWESSRLNDSNWKPMGIAMQASTSYGEKTGGLQAPFVFRDGASFIMFYGGWESICSASSHDGKNFERIVNGDGKATLFGEGPGANSRDPVVIHIADTWRCYYTAHPDRKGADYCRISRDLKNWSDGTIVAKGGEAGSGPYSAECPFVVELSEGEGDFYLFRTQRYGRDAISRLYHSHDPMDFGIDHDAGHLVGSLPVAAPEVVHISDKWYMAALLPNLKGIQISEFAWTPVANSN